MRSISVQEANLHLSKVSMEIGQWNRIAHLPKVQGLEAKSIKYRAPKASRELYCFAQHVAGWLPTGEWKLLQLDNSSGFDAAEAVLVGRLLLGSSDVEGFDLIKHRSYLTEFGSDQIANSNAELLLSNVISAFLLFEQHAYLASAGSHDGQLLGIQDGFVYFLSRDNDVSGAGDVLKAFEKNPAVSPKWVVELIADAQEREIQRAKRDSST